MAYFSTEPASERRNVSGKNRVWDFFRLSNETHPANRLQPAQPRRKIRPTAMKTVSGIPYWPSRDPIGEKGGVNLYGFVRNDGLDQVDNFGMEPTTKLLLIVGPDLAEYGDLKWVTNPMRSNEDYDIFHYRQGDPLSQRNDIYSITRHDFPNFSPAILTDLISRYKLQWELSKKKKCCVRFDYTKVVGESTFSDSQKSKAMDAERVYDILRDPRSKEYSKIVLVAHGGTLDDGGFGLYLAIGRLPYGAAKTWHDWAGWRSIPSIFKDFPASGLTIDIFTCWANNVPSAVGGLHMRGIGDGDDATSKLLFGELEIAPWVNEECDKSVASDDSSAKK